MAEYSAPIVASRGNIFMTKNGSAFALYAVDPPVVSPYSPETVLATQDAHEHLITSIINTDALGMSFYGMLASVPKEEILNRVVSGLPNLSNKRYANALKALKAFNEQLTSGMINEKRRVHLITVELDTNVSFFDGVMQAFGMSTPEITPALVSKEQAVFDAIPPRFNPQRGSLDLLYWALHRATTRGVADSQVPPLGEQPVVKPSHKAFPEVKIDLAASGTSLIDDLARRVAMSDAEVVEKADTFRRNLRDIHTSGIIEVRNLSTANPNFPAGMASYQAVVEVTGFPTTESYAVTNLTGIVDQATGTDADYAIHLRFDDSILDSERHENALTRVKEEKAANTVSELSAPDYDDAEKELWMLSNSLREERTHGTPRGVRVSAFFAFGHANLALLRANWARIKDTFDANSFRVSHPTGYGDALWRATLPCVPVHPALRNFEGATTVKLFSAYMPMRSYRIGDGVGIPFAINVGNALNQVVHLDLMRATDRGNASMVFTGAQGSGKSHAMKLLVGWLNDLNQYTTMLDPEGEWAVFSRSLDSVTVINVAEPEVSLDPFKLLPDNPVKAADLFVEMMAPMLGVRSDSPEMAAIIRVVSPEFRAPRDNLKTSRQIIEHLVNDPSFDLRGVQGTLKAMLESPYMAAFVDPEVGGRVKSLPPADFSTRSVVFMTKGLNPPTAGKRSDEWTLQERYTLLVNTMVARLTEWRFDRIRDADQSRTSVCAFVGDEMSFFDGLDVLNPLIKDVDRKGRKSRRFVVAGSQLAEDISNNGAYALINKRIALRQESYPNAVDALAWAGFDTPEWMVEDLMYNTSPLDPDRENMPVPGRGGECYAALGGSRGRGKIRILPHMLPARAKLSDTRSSKYIRLGDLKR